MTTTSQIDGRFVPSPTDAVATVELDGEAVLYDEVTAAVHVLNPTATLVWSCLDGRSSLDEIAGDLATVFGADMASVSSEVLVLVRQLGAKGLLRDVDAAADAVPDAG